MSRFGAYWAPHCRHRRRSWPRCGADRVPGTDSGAAAARRIQHRAGFRFPYGDYFGITVDRHGTSYLTWSEGTNYDGPGGTWWSRNR